MRESVKVVKAKKHNCRVCACARTRRNRFIEILTITFFITAMLKIEGWGRRFYTWRIRVGGAVEIWFTDSS